MQEGTSELDNAYKLLVLSSSKAGQYIEGAKVEAQFGSETGEWFKGKIDRVNNDGTFDILYDDGDRERVVQKHRIRLKETANTDISSKDIEDDINSDGVFKEGDAVEAMYGDGPEWFPGSISAVNNDGTYNIKYSDGDSEMNVLKEYIRVPLVGGGSFSEGDPIEALFRGESEWFPGMISKVHDNNTYDIMYYDGDIEEQVASTLIRMSDNNAAKAAQTAVANSPKASQVPPDADEESEDDGPLLEGSAVEALSGGNWVSGQIKNVREKKVEGKDETTISTFTYDILFDDGERESKMDASDIRVLSAEDAVAAAANLEGNKKYLENGMSVDALYNKGNRWFAGNVGKKNVHFHH
eukprot:GSMAST32.ASY1.ANO1.302.1 assembled CDS